MNKADFIVDKAVPEDSEWIARVQVAMAKETEDLNLSLENVHKGVAYIFNHPDRGFYIVAKNEDQSPVACLLILKEWSDWRNGDVWWIHSVYVEPANRKMGLFRKMFESVEDMARRSGVRGLRLYVDKTNVNAQQVYKQLGMVCDHYELYEKMF